MVILISSLKHTLKCFNCSLTVSLRLQYLCLHPFLHVQTYVQGQIILASHSAFELQIIAYCFHVICCANLICHVSSRVGCIGAISPTKRRHSPYLSLLLLFLCAHLSLSLRNYISQGTPVGGSGGGSDCLARCHAQWVRGL